MKPISIIFETEEFADDYRSLLCENPLVISVEPESDQIVITHSDDSMAGKIYVILSSEWDFGRGSEFLVVNASGEEVKLIGESVSSDGKNSWSVVDKVMPGDEKVMVIGRKDDKIMWMQK